MPKLAEGDLIFDFPNNWTVEKIENFSFYRNQFQKVCGGSKIVDFICKDDKSEIWLIEVKDYRNNVRQKITPIQDEIALKVRDTLAMLAAARVNANDEYEKKCANQMMKCSKIHLVLHLERSAHRSQIFSLEKEASNLLQKLNQLLKPIDPHPKITSSTNTKRVPFTVT